MQFLFPFLINSFCHSRVEKVSLFFTILLRFPLPLAQLGLLPQGESSSSSLVARCRLLLSKFAQPYVLFFEKLLGPLDVELVTPFWSRCSTGTRRPALITIAIRTIQFRFLPASVADLSTLWNLEFSTSPLLGYVDNAIRSKE